MKSNYQQHLLVTLVLYFTGISSLPAQELDPKSAKEVKSEAGVFLGNGYASRSSLLPGDKENTRKFDHYFSLRQYHGAPPTVPHPLEADMSDSNENCLTCHSKGGYVTKFKAYAPITPHPEMVNCRQCHVPKTTESLFNNTEIDWLSISPPKRGRAMLPGSPPPIPHKLQMRENCLACHSGPSAVQKMRTSHPERANCRQCHVIQEVQSIWQRSEGTKTNE